MDPKRFELFFSPSAQRDIKKLETGEAVQIIKDIKNYLEINPFPLRRTRIKKLTGFKPPLYRLRSGDFRAYYRILGRQVVVMVITHKKDSERLLKKFR